MNELIKIEKPQLPEKWDYDISVQKIKEIFANWKKVTIELIRELWIAHQIFSSPGARTDLKPTQTWKSYYKETKLV